MFLGTEEAIFATEEQNDKSIKAEIMDQLLSMKTQVIESIRTNTPLSPLHEELHKKWKSQYYPSAYDENSEVTNRETSLEISEILSEWYLESYNIQIPIFQFTDEEFKFSSHWGQLSMDYSTKVLLPVVQQLLSNSNKSLILEDLTTTLPGTGSRLPSESLENSCVTWGGNTMERPS